MIVLSLKERERKNQNLVNAEFDCLSLTAAMNLLLKEENLHEITNVLIEKSKLKLDTRTSASDIENWLQTKVEDLLKKLSDPFARKELMDNYSYKKDKEKGQTVLRNHYLKIRKYSKILKAFPLMQSKIQTV